MNESSWPATGGARCPLLVGRARPLATIAAAASGATGAPSVLIVTGPAGIGKTRIAREAVGGARAHGQPQMFAACHAETTLPYEPFVTILRRALRGHHADEVARLFRGPRRLASVLLAELGEGTDAVHAIELDPLHLHAALLDVLTTLVEGRRSLLCLEDLHWADEETVRLLTHIVREIETLPFWVVATCRDDEVGEGHPLRLLLREARRSPVCALLRLAPLEHGDVAAMVSAMLGDEAADTSTVAAVVQRSQGNPLFVEELCVTLADRDEAGPASSDLSTAALPASIRDSILGRLHRTAEPTRRLLCLAAVAGDSLDLQLLQAASAMNADALDTAIAEGVSAFLVVERRAAGPADVAFRHATIREALISDLTGGTRRDAHRRIARALAALSPVERSGEISDHFAGAGDIAQARSFALVAARASAQRGAAAECRHRYENALALSADPGERLSTLVEAAETLRAADPDTAEGFVHEGTRLGRRLQDAVAAARLLVVEAVMTWWRGDSATALRAFTDAYALVRGRGDAWELRILLELARAHANRDEIDEARALVERGRELMSSGAGQPRDTVELLNLAALLGQGDVQRSQRYEAALQAAATAGDPAIECVTVADAGFAALWWPGDLSRAHLLLGRAAAAAEEVRPVNAIAYRAASAWIEALSGDLASAMVTAVKVLDQTRNPPPRLMALLALAEVHERRGEWAAADAAAAEALALAEATGEPQWTVPATSAVARARLRRGVDQARPLFHLALRRGAGRQPHWYASPDLARALEAVGARAELAQWSTAVSGGSAPGSHRHDAAAQHFIAGLAAGAAGDMDRAHILLSEARDAYRSMPCPGREAEVELALAAAALRSGAREEAVRAATAASGLAEHLQSAPLLSAAHALLRRTGVRQAPTPARDPRHGVTLSAREVEVADLVAAGLSNRDIAARLFISENTVERHVSNILGKLGFRRRAQVARWAAERTRITDFRDAIPGPPHLHSRD